MASLDEFEAGGKLLERAGAVQNMVGVDGLNVRKMGRGGGFDLHKWSGLVTGAEIRQIFSAREANTVVRGGTEAGVSGAGGVFRAPGLHWRRPGFADGLRHGTAERITGGPYD